MSLNKRFYSLSLLHRRLDDAMRRERGRDPLRLLRLCALKLAVKRRLAALMHRPALAR